MDKADDALVQLKDIHLPSPIGLWPLAPGWYILMALAVLLVIACVWWLHKRRREALPKKQALALLQKYLQAYLQDNNASLACARISELLKRVALVYYPRQEVANMHGDNWIVFLNQTSKNLDFNQVRQLLLELPFKAKEGANLEPLLKHAEQWIQQRRGPCLN